MPTSFWMDVITAVFRLVESALGGDTKAKRTLEEILGPRDMLEIELAANRAKFVANKGK